MSVDVRVKTCQGATSFADIRVIIFHDEANIQLQFQKSPNKSQVSRLPLAALPVEPEQVKGATHVSGHLTHDSTFRLNGEGKIARVFIFTQFTVLSIAYGLFFLRADRHS